MLKTLHIIIALSFALPLAAQNVIDVAKSNTPISINTVSGNIILTDKYVSLVKGTPYFKDDYLPSNFVIGSTRDKAMVKLNLLTGDLIFKDERGREIIASTEINKVILTDDQTQEKYTFDHSSILNTTDKLSKGWYQELVTGTVDLYKFYKKELSETRPYGQATTEQTINTVPMYFVLKNNQLTRIKKLKELQALLSDKAEEVATFIKTNKLVENSEGEYIQVVKMYNGLSK